MRRVTCAWCGKYYDIKQHQLDRKIREGKACCCSISCGRQYYYDRRKRNLDQLELWRKEKIRLDFWKKAYDEGYQQAILDGR